MKRALLCFLLACLMTGHAHAAEPAPLDAGAIPALTAPPAHGERVIALWSLDCAYCEANLNALAKLQRAHPDAIELVVIATDGPAQRQAVTTRLRAMNMADAGKASYFYAEPAPERLNYLLDPDWGGELPRTLVIRADGTRTGISGELTARQLGRITP